MAPRRLPRAGRRARPRRPAARELQAPPEPLDLSDFDAHAWDWLWAARLKLRRPGHEWLVYLELVKFVETMLLAGFGALARGAVARRAADAGAPVARGPRAARCALPAAPEDAELRRALKATIASYVALRPRLAAERGMPLADDLAAQVLPVLTEA